MSDDLETRVRAELAVRADDARHLPAGGAALRETARRRRTARRRIAAAATAVVAVAGAGVVALGSGSPEAEPPPVSRPTTTSTPDDRTQPDPAWLQVSLSDVQVARAVAATGGDASMSPVAAARIPGSDRVVVLLGGPHGPDGSVWVGSATFDPDQTGSGAVSGTTGTFPSYSSLIALPVHDGDATMLVLLLPPGIGDTVEATSSVPGEPLQRTSAFVHDRMAFVPVRGPESVTRVRVLREGRPVVDTIPASSSLGADVPRTLERVVAASGGPPNQPVQVRTDGATACRLTVGGWWDGPAYVPWNPFDAACAPVDGRLHLLLAVDRRYSSVAGLAPPGTTSVRLAWRDGAATEVSVTRGGAHAFVDSSGRRPDRLVRAEALDAQGLVLATETP